MLDIDLGSPFCSCDEGYVPVDLNCIPGPTGEPGTVVDVGDENKQGLGYTGPNDEYEFEEAIPLFGTIPSRVNLRDKYLDTYAKHQSDQGGCGWCVAHATTHHIEAVQARKKLTATNVSEPHLWYLGGLDIKDCPGGWNIVPALSVAITKKLLKEKDWKYVPPMTGTELKVPAQSVLNRADVACTGINSVKPSSGSGLTVTEKLKRVLAANSTVIVGVTVYGVKDPDSDEWVLPQWRWPEGSSPVDLPTRQESVCGGHAIMLVGYDDNESGGAFIFRNSWGNYWQDDGYGRITYRYMNEYFHEGAYLSNCAVGCVPETEKCDNRDNDCDGQIDENLKRSCGTDVGECSAGTQVCTKGTWGSCSDEVPPEVESCDGKDNDCDGDTDEEYSIGQTCGTGACAGGEIECKEDGKSSMCNTMPGGSKDRSLTEICDLIDNDCDGLTDENLVPIEQPIENRCPTRGICSNGAAFNVCVNGKWECRFPADYIEVECPIAVAKCGTGSISDLSCRDELDNDCDGVTDENSAYYRCRDLPDFWKIAQGIECFHGPYGRCQISGGTYECIQLAETCGVQIDCVGGIHPEAERCDEDDWDCDGDTHDRGDTDLDGYGDCTERRDCNEADAKINPDATEICDGKDNDCDGKTDEGNPGGGASCNTGKSGVCKDGVITCTSGKLVCKQSIASSKEVCNGKDDDCDGSTDESNVCVTTAQIPSITVDRLTHLRGDGDFDGSGPRVDITVTFSRTSSSISASAKVLMRETPVAPEGEGGGTQARGTASQSKSVANRGFLKFSGSSPVASAQYTDTDHAIDDVRSEGLITDPYGFISSIKCAGDSYSGDDACTTKDYPTCSGCVITFKPIEVLKPYE